MIGVKNMAQLVKLLDYISRYENDLTRYPNQFLRLKRSQWDRMKIQWETGSDHTMWEEAPEEVEKEKGKLSSLFRFFGSRQEEADLVDNQEQVEEDEDDFGFTPNIVYTPETIEQLRKLYLDQLFHFQIKWASSTLMDKSRVDSKYMRDSLLRSFAQKLPDSYLLFYQPIIKLQKAPVELDIVIVTPVECMCITVLEQEDLTAFVGSSDRFWEKRTKDKESKVLNPILSLNRMGKIVSQLFHEKDINFPVKKYLISRNGYIDYPRGSFDVKIVDRRNYEDWFSSICSLTTPLKFAQFQAAQAILDVGQTTAMSKYFEFDDEQGGNEGETNSI